MSITVNLPIAVYRFHYQAQGHLSLPSQPGVLWHSVFGKALRETVCITKSQSCEQCLFLQQCDYTHLFVGTKPPASEIMRKYTTVPSPHVLRSIPNSPLVFHPEQEVTLEIVLMGNTFQRFPALVSALQRAGLHGLGRQRTVLKLIRVEQQQADGQFSTLLTQGEQQELLPASQQPTPVTPEQVRVSLLTPYKPSGKNGQQSMAVDHWLMAIIRRVDLLQYFTTGVKLEADFKRLKALTQQVGERVGDSPSLTWLRSERYSAQQRRSKPTDGFVGEFVVDLRGCEDLWAFMWLGQYLHVGKNASMGFGRYQLEPIGQ